MNDIGITPRSQRTGPKNTDSSISKLSFSLTNGRSVSRCISQQLRTHEPYFRQNSPCITIGRRLQEQSVAEQTENASNDLFTAISDAHGNVVPGGNSTQPESRSAALNTDKPRLSLIETKKFLVEQNLLRLMKSSSGTFPPSTLSVITLLWWNILWALEEPLKRSVFDPLISMTSRVQHFKWRLRANMRC